MLNLLVPIYRTEWREALGECLTQEHHTVFLDRTRTWITRSGVELTNHEATAPATQLHCLRAKGSCCGCLFIVFSANPVSWSERCVAPRINDREISTTQPYKQTIESTKRRLPPKQQKAVSATTETTPKTMSIKNRLYIQITNLARIQMHSVYLSLFL